MLWILLSLCCVLLVVGGAWTWTKNDAPQSVTTTMSTPGERATAPTSGTLTAPQVSVVREGSFLSEVTEVDPSLMTYEKREGNLALRSLLTDGSAFCAFLQRDRDVDAAMISLAVGARQVELQTRLPLSVTTFNAIDSVALLTLCPSLQSILPASVRVRVRALGASLEG